MKKMNCWEFMQCERQPGGERIKTLGICPVSVNWDLDGVNGGIGAGRACWAVAGSFCNGRMQGTFAEKLRDCRKCDFMSLVKREEELAPLGFLATPQDMVKALKGPAGRRDPGKPDRRELSPGGI